MRKIAAIVAVVCITGAASADSVMYNDSIPLSTTNWSSSVTIPQFNPTLGILDSIEFSLAGHVEGDASYESLDAAPATVTLELAAEIELQRPDNSVLVAALPLVQTVENAAAHDGNIDFDGPSGSTFDNLSGDQTEMATLGPPVLPSDLAIFVGFGSISLPVEASGASQGSGAGNLLLQFHTSASADVAVTYNYTVPEPGSLALLTLGALGLLRRR